MSGETISLAEKALALHKGRYPGVAKEYAILYELLHRIESPSQLAQNNELTTQIKVATGLEVRLRTMGHLLFFYLHNTDSQLFAQLELSKNILPGKLLNTSVDNANAETIFRITRTFINEKKGRATIISDWVRQHFKVMPKPGIWRLLAQMEEGEKRSISISFQNDVSHKIERIFDYLFHAEAVVYKMSILLNNGATMDISPEEKLFSRAVNNAARLAYSMDDFVARLNTNYEYFLRLRDKEKGHNYKGYEINIYILEGSKVKRSTENLLHQMRTYQDTKRALSRLVQLDIVDYFKEENAEFNVFFTKKASSAYEVALQKYLSRYEVYESVKEWIRRVYRRPLIEEDHPSLIFAEGGKTQLSREADALDYLRVLLRFLYAKVAPNRAKTVQRLAEGYDYISELRMDNSPAFFYDKKYAHPAHQPNLIEDTNRGRLMKLETVWKYMDAVKDEANGFTLLNIRQLKTSVETLLVQYPGQPVFVLLRGFCKIYLSTKGDYGKLEVVNEGQLKAGVSDYLDGFLQFKKLHHLSIEEMETHTQQFEQKTIQYKSELKNVMKQARELLYLETQNRWLRDLVRTLGV